MFFGGQAGASGHITIGSGAKMAGQTGVTKDVPPGMTMGGMPALPIRDWHRQAVLLSKLIHRDK